MKTKSDIHIIMHEDKIQAYGFCVTKSGVHSGWAIWVYQ
jgi:hypothetical protein